MLHVFTFFSTVGTLIQSTQVHIIPHKKADESPPLGKITLLKTYDILVADSKRIPPSAKGTAKRWPIGQYLQACFRDGTTTARCQIPNLAIYNFTYADCPNRDPWRFRRCSDSEFSIDDMIEGFGTVSPGMRSNVKNLMWTNGQGSAGGGEAGGNIFGFGPVIKVFFTHEATHASDPNDSLSRSKKLTSAIAKDTCVPNEYANKNEAEDLAEIGVWLHWGTHPTIDYAGDASCMKNQLSVAKELLGPLLDAKGQCFNTLDPDPIVTSDQGGVGLRHRSKGQVLNRMSSFIWRVCKF